MNRLSQLTFNQWLGITLVLAIVASLYLNTRDGNSPVDPDDDWRPSGDVSEIAEESIRRLAKEYATVSGVSARKSRSGEFETIEDLHSWEQEAFEEARHEAFEDLNRAMQDALGPEDDSDEFNARKAEEFAKQRDEGFHRAYEGR